MNAHALARLPLRQLSFLVCNYVYACVQQPATANEIT